VLASTFAPREADAVEMHMADANRELERDREQLLTSLSERACRFREACDYVTADAQLTQRPRTISG
jgi:hypothetical protein